MSKIYLRFEKYLSEKINILDAGCGSGRDTKYFLSKAYNVTAVDASEEMVKCAKDFTGIEVKQQLFEDFTYTDKFDAIWSCASLLHVPKQNMPYIFNKFIIALKEGGVWYMSFKMGSVERIKDGRKFSDYTKNEIVKLLLKFAAKIINYLSQ